MPSSVHRYFHCRFRLETRVYPRPASRLEHPWANTRYFKSALAAAGFKTGMSETPIPPVMVGDAALAHSFSRALFEEGVLATGIAYPTVPQGKARVRTIVTATHTRAPLDQAVQILGGVARQLRILR